jgi:lipid-binding SYLF domain-containing protein
MKQLTCFDYSFVCIISDALVAHDWHFLRSIRFSIFPFTTFRRFTMRMTLASSILLATLLTACSGAPKTAEQKESLSNAVKNSVELVKAADPTLQKLFDSAYGYAVLPSVGKGGFLIGGAGGDGEMFQGGKLVGYCSMGQGTIGATIGGQSFDEFIFLKDEASYKDFTSGQFTVAAQVSAVIVKAGTGAAAAYQNGVALFVNNAKGAMAEAAVGGQQFNFVPLSSAK